MKAGEKCERQAGTDEQAVSAGYQTGVKKLPTVAVMKEYESVYQASQRDACSHGKKTPWRTQEIYKDGPEHVKLLFDMKRPEVNKAYKATIVEVPSITGAGREQAV